MELAAVGRRWRRAVAGIQLRVIEGFDVLHGRMLARDLQFYTVAGSVYGSGMEVAVGQGYALQY